MGERAVNEISVITAGMPVINFNGMIIKKKNLKITFCILLLLKF